MSESSDLQWWLDYLKERVELYERDPRELSDLGFFKNKENIRRALNKLISEIFGDYYLIDGDQDYANDPHFARTAANFRSQPITIH